MSEIYEKDDVIKLFISNPDDNTTFKMLGPYESRVDVDSEEMFTYYFVDISQSSVHGDDIYACLTLTLEDITQLSVVLEKMKTKAIKVMGRQEMGYISLGPRVKPNEYVSKFQVFCTYHYENMWESEVPNYFSYGNAIWIGLCYYGGGIEKVAGTELKKREFVVGSDRLYRKLYLPQKNRQKFLYSYDDKLCGPDQYWDLVIWPLGMEFYFGTMSQEMMYMIRRNVSFKKIMSHDFNRCPIMRRIRKRERSRDNAITAIL